MKFYYLIILSLLGLAGCASVKVADNVKMISFTDKTGTTESKSLGNIEGKDCTWSIFGHSLGGAPTVRTAFQNTAEQKDELIPLIKKKKEGTIGNIGSIRNVAVDPSGFSAWFLGRTCINVTGVGYQ